MSQSFLVLLILVRALPLAQAIMHGLTEITDFLVLKMALLSFTGIEARRVGLLLIHIHHPPVELKTILFLHPTRLASIDKKTMKNQGIASLSGLHAKAYTTNLSPQ